MGSQEWSSDTPHTVYEARLSVKVIRGMLVIRTYHTDASLGLCASVDNRVVVLRLLLERCGVLRAFDIDVELGDGDIQTEVSETL